MTSPAPIQTAAVATATLPYLTIAEYKASPSAINTDNLVPRGGPAAQDAELAKLILRASAWCDTCVRQKLPARPVTEQRTVRIDRQGRAPVHPAERPALELRAFSWGMYASSLTALTDLSGVWIEEDTFYVPLAGGAPFVGSLPMTYLGLSGDLVGVPVLCRYTYVAGYAVTTTTAAASAGASTLAVASVDGMLPGTVIRAGAGILVESHQVASVSGLTVTIADTLVNAQPAGAPVTSLPEDVIEAAVMVTTAFIRMRGTDSVTMANRSATVKTGPTQAAVNDLLAEAELMLAGYEPMPR
jgi:hypothetical protein